MEIPQVGLGTYQMQDVTNNVTHAIQCGYKHIDTARFYKNEKMIAPAIKKDRSSLFITSKLWITDFDRVSEACQESLDDLGIQQLDLFLIHWPFSFNPSTNEAKEADIVALWKQMEALVANGKTRYIGISNFTVPLVKRLLDNCTIKPYANQFEIHPYCFSTPLIQFCQENGIKVIAYCSLGASACDYWAHPLLKALSEKHSASISQLLLSWAVQKGIHVIPKSNTPSRIEENLKVLQEDLSEMDQLMQEKQLRVYDPKKFFGYALFD